MTVLVYLLGIFTFFITCLASQAIFNKFTIKSKYSIRKRINKLNISKSKLALIIVIQLITLALTYIFYLDIMVLIFLMRCLITESMKLQILLIL